MVRFLPKLLQAVCSAAILALIWPVAALAQPAEIAIGYLSIERAPLRPVSPLDEGQPDSGLDGARLGVSDNNTTGRFTDQHFTLIEKIASDQTGIAAALRELADRGVRFLVADLPADELGIAAKAGASLQMTVLNVRAPDDSLRNEGCRANLLHTIPSRAQIADALAQYLVWKKWTRWFLVVGRNPGDAALAEAYRRAATRFGAEIVVQKRWTFQPGNMRADTGHVALQTEIPVFTRVADYDVLLVADEENEFGEDLAGRTALPRVVAGTHGLLATGWSPVNEQWGAMQIHSRFRKATGRRMDLVNYAAWLAVRSVGEAAVRAKSSDPATILAFMRSTDFVVAGFKGQGLSFRDWDGQMRQPMLIAGPRVLVSASPQPGFLHQFSELDTLGTDREESRCHF